MSRNIKQQQIEKIAELSKKSYTLRQIAKIAAIHVDTVVKYQKKLNLETGFCECGKPMRHRGWCRIRYARSIGRQTFMQKWRTRTAPDVFVDLSCPPAKELTFEAVSAMTDLEAEKSFQEIRFYPTNGEPCCPLCGIDGAYNFGHRRNKPLWRCRKCREEFTLTSKTQFQSRKLPIKFYLLAMTLALHEDIDISARQLGKRLGINYRSAYYIAQDIMRKPSDFAEPAKSIPSDDSFLG